MKLVDVTWDCNNPVFENRKWSIFGQKTLNIHVFRYWTGVKWYSDVHLVILFSEHPRTSGLNRKWSIFGRKSPNNVSFLLFTRVKWYSEFD